MQPFHNNEAYPLPSPQLPPPDFRRRHPAPTPSLERQRNRRECPPRVTRGPTLHHHSAFRGDFAPADPMPDEHGETLGKARDRGLLGRHGQDVDQIRRP